MRIASEQDREKIISYLSEDIDNCVYLYIDIKTYDLSSENITVWIQEEADEISLIVMKYYDSFQIYSRNKQLDYKALGEFLNDNQVAMISGPKWLIELISDICYNYSVVYGSVFRCYNY